MIGLAIADWRLPINGCRTDNRQSTIGNRQSPISLEVTHDLDDLRGAPNGFAIRFHG